jgi:hypothetical protein
MTVEENKKNQAVTAHYSAAFPSVFILKINNTDYNWLKALNLVHVKNLINSLHK